MSERYPRVRSYSKDGLLALREGVHLCFFMRRSHAEVSPLVARALDVYLGTVGSEGLSWYDSPEGDIRPLDDKGWEYIRYRLLDTTDAEGCALELLEHAHRVSGYRFKYNGNTLDSPAAARWPGMVSGVSFWLPTEDLEERGPTHVRELAVTLARELPLTSGYASLAFNSMEVLGSDRTIRELCLQYPGLDVHELDATTMAIGAGVRGPYWLNFFGQPLLGRFGGTQGLRARLPNPEIGIQELEQEKVLVALGEWPVTGHEEQLEILRPYRELARVLEPHLYEETLRWRSLNPTRMRKWQRRFLDT